ncbi:hypothetical protein [Bradyrhizobium elkanii]|uniref:hypothetical protein n=1 Tax=Bradyrhizobium elkanii TaxID=29448 RepID=UPI00084129B1|nr:hypothetical protein [Bradyrhizobium elkanii]ODM76734.1 hypothetical protein A6X20_29210 [Bradyrhizobium elkanii]ODM80812.1 hypothetical protein A6452_23755 [Bradyrhizobium elkanii]
MPVAFSGGTTGASRQKYTVLIVYQDKMLAVTSDHIFLMSDGTLKRADRLVVGDAFMGYDGNAVRLHSVHIGDYTAGFHHIATSRTPPPINLAGHLINTNGVISGDYAVQLFGRSPAARQMFAPDHHALPVIGSREYVQQHGEACRTAPQALPQPQRGQRIAISSQRALDGDVGRFIPANHTILAIPHDATSFISEQEAQQKALEPSRPWNDPESREWVEYLLRQYHTYYPAITYQLDWADDTVNAYAWIANGVRHVAIKGGIVRHFALALEGLSLVIAHETGHRYGGAPTFPSGLSCEGQADFNGVAAVMRNVWFGDFYLQMVEPAIQQMADFFGVPNSPNTPGGSAGCNHPPGACRIATYHAAVNLDRKPACAS